MDDDPHLGWGTLVGDRIQLAHIDCDHMKMLEPENLPALAKLLRAWLGGSPKQRRSSPLALTA
jgi:thioesterase domain-containing protein